MKNRMASAAALLMLCLMSTIPAATAQANQSRAAINFTLNGCPTLPSGLTVYGSGEDFLVVNTLIDRDGTAHIQRNDLVTGSATDSAGATYLFNYHNHATMQIPAGGFPFTLDTTDHFNLVGNGQATQLQVHFVARVTFFSPTDFSFEFVNARGNPFQCDAI
jgi:hypothetical protein